MKRSASIAACLFISAATWVAAGPAASAEPTSRYTQIGDCRDVARSVADVDPEDWGLIKCSGLPGWPVWIFFYDDAIKQRVGFGRQQNVSGLFWGLDIVDKKTPLEWRGLEKRGRFEPFAAIFRVRSPNPGESLVVYRLRSDGTSCILNDDTGSNAKAREIADASRTGYTCQKEPDLSRVPGSGWPPQ